MAETLVQLLLAAMLALTVVWCTMVHRRLQRLRADRGELEAFVTSLTRASERAEAAIAGLRSAGETIIGELSAHEDAARRAAAELGRQVDSAGRLARRLSSAEPGPRSATELPIPVRRPSVQHAPDPGVTNVADTGAGSLPPSARPRMTAELMRTLQSLR